MGLYSGGLIIGRIFASEIWGANFREGLFIYLFIIIMNFFFFGGGGLIIGILRYLQNIVFMHVGVTSYLQTIVLHI